MRDRQSEVLDSRHLDFGQMKIRSALSFSCLIFGSQVLPGMIGGQEVRSSLAAGSNGLICQREAVKAKISSRLQCGSEACSKKSEANLQYYQRLVCP